MFTSSKVMSPVWWHKNEFQVCWDVPTGHDVSSSNTRSMVSTISVYYQFNITPCHYWPDAPTQYTPLGIGVYWVDAPVHIIMPFTIYQNLVSLIERKYNFYTPVWGQFRHIAFKTGDSVNWNIKVNRILKVISTTWKFRFSSWIQ